jgi:hypothetical protein
MKPGFVNQPMMRLGLFAALSLAMAQSWHNMARMLTRSWDINGRERFNFDWSKAHRQALKNRRRGGKV